VSSQREPSQERRDGRLDSIQRAYGDAVLQGDAAGAERVIAEAIEAGLGQQEIDDEVIAPVMRMVGDLWAQGELSVADEHLATEITLRVLALQREAFRTVRRRARERVLLAAAPGEQHVVGLRMAANVLEAAGYGVIMLGPDVPPDALAAAVARHGPTVLGLTAAMHDTAAHVPGAIERAQRAGAGVGVVVGGAGVAEGFIATPGVLVCHHVSDAVELVDALVQRAPLQ
jgi:methanogenic corrinoid protein MtbC1